MALQARKRSRDGEYAKAVFAKTMLANPKTREANVWLNLKGNSPHMQALQKEFMEAFQQKGFGCVEGSKWTEYERKQEVAAEVEYLTKAQIYKREANDQAATDAKIAWAVAQGEGTPEPGQGKGWFKDPSRGGQPVYKHDHGYKYKDSFTKNLGRKTLNSSGPTSIGDVTPSSALPEPAPAHSQLATSSAAQAAPASALPPLPAAGTEDTSDATAEINLSEMRAKADDQLNQMAGNECMSGFVKELNAAITAYDAIKGTPKPNYRAVRNLMQMVTVVERVLKIMDDVHI